MTAVRHLLIPAAGLCTRMWVVDAERPKGMLPLNGKPAISHTVAEGVDAEVIYLYQEVLPETLLR
jgi:UTP-glucose-1-phosphate uridylyltransferase